ncbi:MAG: hypothetical protein AAGF75_01535 [Cyanobacteria bacterium P01_H01_bin.130]
MTILLILAPVGAIALWLVIDNYRYGQFLKTLGESPDAQTTDRQ